MESSLAICVRDENGRHGELAKPSNFKGVVEVLVILLLDQILFMECELSIDLWKNHISHTYKWQNEF